MTHEKMIQHAIQGDVVFWVRKRRYEVLKYAPSLRDVLEAAEAALSTGRPEVFERRLQRFGTVMARRLIDKTWHKLSCPKTGIWREDLVRVVPRDTPITMEDLMR